MHFQGVTSAYDVITEVSSPEKVKLYSVWFNYVSVSGS